MADKQATPRTGEAWHPNIFMTYFQMPDASVDVSSVMQLYRAKPLPLRAIWRTETGPAKVTCT